MSGQDGETRTDAGRFHTVGIVLIVLLAAALAGFLAGAFAGEGEWDVTRGLLFTAAFLLPTAGAAAWAWWRTRRRAAGFGLSPSRYMRVGRQIQRGRLPQDPAELPAATDVVRRQRRTLSAQRRRWVWWLMSAAAVLLLMSAAAQVLDQRYGFAGLNLLALGMCLINPFVLRRQRRRMHAVEQALATAQQPQVSSCAVEVSPHSSGPREDRTGQR
ncbi:hypothetical protein AB0939_17770 [Streptomyces sp. NPDC006990]|uniref:hypothetical protein n=1 Tax=Streptomyces sp. NPDC006990 TaxID=3154481 RepID=UPI0034561B44